MASKKTGKKKTGKKKARTAAQKAATAKLVAMNKGKKTGKKKGSKKTGKRRAHKAYTGGDYTPHKRYKPSVGEQFAGERGGQRFHGPMTPAQALAEANRAIEKLKRVTGGKTHRKASKKRTSTKLAKHHSHGGKSSGVVTAASILKGAKSNSLKLYVCAGKKFTGCGGGRKGAHVVGHLRA